jgi:uncharacterized membrane protein
MKHRYAALDWMRGVVMVLMAIDHASAAFNKGRLVTDSFFLYQAGMFLPAFQFYTRWVTHICAPTFLFLAGTALALSVERRLRNGDSNWAIDRHLLLRGFSIALFDIVLISWFWYPGSILLQVLYAIGFSIILMIPLRRLSSRWLFGIAVGYFLLNDALLGIVLSLTGNQPTLIGGLFLYGGLFSGLVIGYPISPWLAMMILGWVFGQYLITYRERESAKRSPEKILMVSGFVAIILFIVLRGMNSYGNLMLVRENNSLIQWLHVSKYPPSFTFAALELGLMCVVLSLLFRIQGTIADRIHRDNPILVFGQTALFFYLLHITILELSAHALGMHMKMGLKTAYVATIAVLIILYPLCRWYRKYKTVYPRSWARYI